MPETKITLYTCCTLDEACPKDIFKALSISIAILYDNLSTDSIPSYGMYIYGNTPCTCKQTFCPKKM